MTLSLIIPTLNAGPLFREVMVALRTQSYPDPIELLVIDSGSTDATLAIAKAFDAVIHTIPPHAFNHGLTRNLAIEKSSGDLIVLLTQDAVPADPHLLAHLTAPYADPLVGGVYARQIPRPDHDCLVARNVRAHLTGSPTPVARHLADSPDIAALPPLERYHLCNFDNVCSSLRRTAWQKVPFVRNDFGEDLDWSKRALQAGFKIVYQPAATVIHSHSRPVRYEYKRTYMCHRKLYELFGLATIPSPRYIPRCLAHSILTDATYVLRHAPTLAQKLSLLAKIPFLSCASVLAQYHGARDERLHRGLKLHGV